MSTKFSDLFEGTVVGSVATITDEGKPWSTPLHIAFDDQNAYWLSSPDTVHSKNIAERPDVSIAIWSRNKNTGLKGAYIQTKARALEGDEAAKGHKIFEETLGDDVPGAIMNATVYCAPIGEKSTTYSTGGFHYFFSDKALDIS